MSLIPCRSCHKPLSSDAKICPNCGAKKPTKQKKTTDYKRIGKLLGILIIVYLLAISLSKLFGISPTPESNIAPNTTNNKYEETHKKCNFPEKTENLYYLMQEMVTWNKHGEEPVIATFKQNYWNESFPTNNSERQKVIQAIADTDFCLNARPRTIYIFDAKGNMIGRATPQKGIEYLF